MRRWSLMALCFVLDYRTNAILTMINLIVEVKNLDATPLFKGPWRRELR